MHEMHVQNFFEEVNILIILTCYISMCLMKNIEMKKFILCYAEIKLISL